MDTKRTARSCKMSTSAVALVMMLAGTAAAAQETPAPENEQAANAGLGEIIVTATRREQNLQRVPATIAALGAEDLENRQIQDVSGLQAEVPSLVVGSYFGTSLITLRGISLNRPGIVGGYLD